MVDVLCMVSNLPPWVADWFDVIEGGDEGDVDLCTINGVRQLYLELLIDGNQPPMGGTHDEVATDYRSWEGDNVHNLL